MNHSSMLAAVGVGNVTLNICIDSIFIGCNMALDTLISQAVGAGYT